MKSRGDHWSWHHNEDYYSYTVAEETLGGELALLDHPARHVFIFKRKQSGEQVEVITRRLTDTECLTRHLRCCSSLTHSELELRLGISSFNTF